MIKYLFLPVLLILTISGYVETLQDSTKSSYNLFHPCQRDQLRSFETDRPDATESPYTVDAGHFQFETDLFKTNRLSVNGLNPLQILLTTLTSKPVSPTRLIFSSYQNHLSIPG